MFLSTKCAFTAKHSSSGHKLSMKAHSSTTGPAWKVTVVENHNRCSNSNISESHTNRLANTDVKGQGSLWNSWIASNPFPFPTPRFHSTISWEEAGSQHFFRPKKAVFEADQLKKMGNKATDLSKEYPHLTSDIPLCSLLPPFY